MQRPLVLVVLVAVVFGRALWGSYVYDDLALIAGNPAIAGGDWWQAVVQPLWGPAFPHWRPLTQVLLWAGHGLGGAAAIHALALAAHALAVVVAYRLALRLAKDARAAFLIACWFAVHPSQVESVAWCAALNDVLWGLCALLALDAHLAHRDAGGGGVPWRAVAWFAAGLLAKETALVIPLLLLAADVLVPHERGDAPRWCTYLRPAVVVVPWLLLRMAVFGDWRAGFDRGPEVELGGRSALVLPFEILGRLAQVLVWELAPRAMRPMPTPPDAASLAFAAAGALAIAGIAVARASGARRVALGIGIAVLPLALAAIRPSAAGDYPIADRYLYTSVFGLALAIVPPLLRIAVLLPALIAGTFALFAWQAVGTWSNQTSFVAAQHTAGDDARVLYMAGQLALEAQPARVDIARRYFAAAALHATAPRFGGEDGRARLAADVAAGLGWCEIKAPQPDWQRAGALFEQVLRQHETHAPSHVGLAVCLAELGNLTGAETHLLRALQLEPHFAAAHDALARVRARRR